MTTIETYLLAEVCNDASSPALSTALVRLREAIARELSVQVRDPCSL